jgi:hypothetical protein
VAILDRLRFVFEGDPAPALQKLKHLRAGRSVFPRRSNQGAFLPYAHVQWFDDRESGMKVCAESNRQGGWLAPYSVTLVADDQTGLLPAEVFGILEVLPPGRMTLVELALDFSPLTNVSRDFIRRYGLFGKSHRDRSGTNYAGDWWGARRAWKRIKSYFKDAVCAHRLEFMLRLRFLRHHGIHDVFDLGRLADLLPVDHLLFARLDSRRLIERLRGSGMSAAKTMDTLKRVVEMEGDLCAALTFLRRDMQLKNARRLLAPLAENNLVLQALREWAAMWPKAPARLGGRK